MPGFGRYFPLVLVLALAGGAVGWVLSFGQLPPADFTWANESEIQSIDPAVAHGNPEGRIMRALFEGLYELEPPAAGDPRSADKYLLVPQPAVAEALPEISADGRTYTIRLRKNARWSDGSAVTAHDFYWSWMRLLHPATAAHYVDHLHFIQNGTRYTKLDFKVGDPVEVELWTDEAGKPLEKPDQPFPRGKVITGRLKGRDEKAKTFDVELAGATRTFRKTEQLSADADACRHVLLDAREVGLAVVDDYTLRITLTAPTPFYTELLAFYTLYPVQRKCVETHGYPHWTRPENLVCNGAFTMQERRIRDRIRLVKNPQYWDAANVHLNTADALAVNSRTTALNMYLNGQVDWITSATDSVARELAQRPDFSEAPFFCTYFYRINTTKPPLNDVRVRRALSLAIDRRALIDAILKLGQQPATHFVPPGMGDYKSPQGVGFNAAEAKKLLAEAGFPGGKGLRRIEILYNKDETHERIAEVIMSQWKEHLGIDVGTVSREWGVYLQDTRNKDYDVSRAGWIGDYHDPMTFLKMFMTGDENNQTGWGNAEFDRLITEAGATVDPPQRLAKMRAAEEVFLRESPVAPIYFYVSKNLVREYVHGFQANRLDQHALKHFRVDLEAKPRVLAEERARRAKGADNAPAGDAPVNKEQRR